MNRFAPRALLALALVSSACSAPQINYVGKQCSDGQCPGGLVCEPATNTCQQAADGGSQPEPDAGFVPTLSLYPADITLLPGETFKFTAVTGANCGPVSWSGAGGKLGIDGSYEAPSAPGNYTVQARLTNYPEVTAEGRVAVVNGGSRNTISGTISYVGQRNKTGRIFIEAQEQNGQTLASTSIPGPGRYLMRGVNLNRTTGIVLRAWMDTLETGQFNPAADPIAVLSDAPVGGDLGADLRLDDPMAVPPGTPDFQGIHTGDRVALVIYQEPSGMISADHYELSVFRTSMPTQGSAVLTRTVRAGMNPPIILVDFGQLMAQGAPAETFYFALRGILDGQAGPYSRSIGQSISGSPTPNAATLTGVIDLAGLLTSQPLFVAAFEPSTNGPPAAIHIGRVDSPRGRVTYSIPVMPYPQLAVGAMIDLDGNGEIAPTEPMTVRSDVGALVDGPGFGGTQVVHDIVLEKGRGFGRALSDVVYDVNGQALIGAGVMLRAIPGSQRIVRASLGAGAGAESGNVPIDLALQKQGDFFLYLPADLSRPPAAGDQYRLDVTYADGMTINERVSVVRVGAFNEAPQAQPVDYTPNGAQFSWIETPFGAHTHFLRLGRASYTFWQADQIPGPSSTFDFDLSQFGPGPYRWTIGAADERGNRVATMAEFLY